MDIFFVLFTNLIPLYALIVTGWIAGRYVGVDTKTISALAIYIFAPVSAFGFVAKINFEPEYILLPVFTWAMCSLVAFLFLGLGRKLYSDGRANLLAMTASMGNTGFLGLPLALTLFDAQWIGLYVLLDIGSGMYVATLMYYIAARGQFSVRDSLIKLTRFPMLYAIILGFMVNKAGVNLPEQFFRYHDYFVGSFVLCGMMIIGVSLSTVKKFALPTKFIFIALIGKIIVWPLFALAFIWLDREYLNLFSELVHKMMFVVSIVPPGASVVAFAAQMDLKPEKAATTVMIGTMFALFLIPLMLTLSGLF